MAFNDQKKQQQDGDEGVFPASLDNLEAPDDVEDEKERREQV